MENAPGLTETGVHDLSYNHAGDVTNAYCTSKADIVANTNEMHGQ